MPNWQDLGSALALMMIFEGLMPFINPQRAKQVFARMAQAEPGGLRIMGLVTISLGLLVLMLVR